METRVHSSKSVPTYDVLMYALISMSFRRVREADDTVHGADEGRREVIGKDFQHGSIRDY